MSNSLLTKEQFRQRIKESGLRAHPSIVALAAAVREYYQRQKGEGG